MIRIVKLSLKNFKSFKKADIPFAHGFTVIAGSNGSGKSNILDALMFSLGITSLKALRASRLTDLVNATAEENYAKVDLEIEHKDQSLVVSRMVDRTGKGVYRLNDDRKTLNEISSLLNELGISANGHNIVVQGDITRVINMGPEERRGIVDEAAGIREFDEKKAEALKELGRVDEKIRDVRIVLNEREAYLKELEAERQAALEHEALEDERTRTRATLLFLALESAKQKLQALSEKRAEKQGQKNALLSEQEQAKARIASLKGELAELHANLLSHSEKMFSQFGSKLEAQRGELRLADERLRTIAESIARNEAEQSAAERERGTLQTQLKEREAEMKTGTMDLPRLIAETDQLTAEKKGFEKHAQTEESRLDELAKERETLEIQLRTLSEQKWAHASKIEELERAYARALSERKSIEKDRVLVVERRDFAKAAFERIAQITTEFRSPEKALEEAQTRHAKALQAHEEAVARIESHRQFLSQLKKADSACPVCDKKLEAKTKAEIEKEKQSHLDQLEERKKTAATHLQKTYSDIARVSGLKTEFDRLSPVAETLTDWNERLNRLNAQWDENDPALFRAQTDDLKKKTLALETDWNKKASARDALIAQIKAAQSGTSLSRMNAITNRLLELQTRRAQLENRLADWKDRGQSSILTQLAQIEERIAARENEIARWKKDASALEKKRAESANVVSGLEHDMKNAERERGDLEKKREQTENESTKASEKLEAINQRLYRLDREENELAVETGKTEVHQSDVASEFEPLANSPRIENASEPDLQKRLPQIEKRLSELGAINQRAIESYNTLKNEMDDISQKLQKLEEERLAVLDMAEQIEVRRREVFLACFEKVQGHFRRLFQTLFTGQGELRLTNPADPLSSGLLIEARHKGDRVVPMESMSGGEKTLTALAFLFAIQLYNPAPFYVFDEADAALDKENSGKLARLIKDISTQSQFIAITHNDNLINEADQIIGVALDKTKSSVLTLRVPRKRTGETTP